jgi:hypothetical protein
MQIWSPAALTAASRSAMSGKSQISGDLYARLPEGMTAAQLTAATEPSAGHHRQGGARRRRRAHAHQGHRLSAVAESTRRANRSAALCGRLRHLGAGLPQCHQPDAGPRRCAHPRAGRARRPGRQPRSSAATDIVESLLLSGIGGVFGLLLGQSAIKLLWPRSSRTCRSPAPFISTGEWSS